VTLDGVDVRAFDPEEYRGLLGVVLQDFARYQLSARENIVLGPARRPVDEHKLVDAARTAGALDVISRLPEGWNTLLGRQFHERGQDLSGGQWQRVALTRALYRDASMLLLDEPTSALDAEAEAALFERYKELASGRTTLLITHRFNTVRMAHRILVMEGGRVVEEGSHDGLLGQDGRYAQMFRVQAQAYV
jgi:ATP-binding cassette subfamily B protein